MKTLQSLLLAIAITTSLFAQPNPQNHTEVSLSGLYQNYSTANSSTSTGAFLISPRVGFYVIKGLEIEPEAMFMFISGSDPVYLLNANISYNFISSAKTVPFLLIGYGISNTVPFLNVPSYRTDFGINVFNIGGGLKTYLNENVALRVEYRYQRFSGQNEENNGFYSYSQNVDNRIHTIQVGFSVLL